MITKFFISTGLIILLFSSCKKEKEGEQSSFSLDGKISENFNGFLYLTYGQQIDSFYVENSTFLFSGKTSRPLEAYLSPVSPNSKENAVTAPFFLEDNDIKIYLDYITFSLDGNTIKGISVDSISGSKSQKLIDDFNIKMKNSFYQEKNDSIREQILYENLDEFITANPKSLHSGKELASLSNFYGLLDSGQMEILYQKIDTNFQDKNDLDYIKKIISRRKVLDIGNIPPRVKLPDLQGEIIDSYSFQGKYVLLEFWASWCGPCRRTNPELLKIYEEYKDEDFVILGISEDKDANKWKAAIIEDMLTWPQVIDTTNATNKLFKITTIPYNVLVNERGEIIARNVKPKKLDQILKARV